MASFLTPFGFGFRLRNFRGTNVVFDQMQPGAATLVIMGLDHGIGHSSTEYS